MSWVSHAKRNIEEQLDKASHCSSKTKSSGRSKMSNISSTSALEKERAKSAELNARVCILEKKQALQNQVERLQLEEELVVAQARESVFAQMEQDEYSMRSHKTQHSEVTQYLLQPKLSETSKVTADYKVSKDLKTMITNTKPRQRETVTTK